VSAAGKRACDDRLELVHQLGVARVAVGHDRAVERAVGPARARLVLGREILECAREQRLDPLGVQTDDPQHRGDVIGMTAATEAKLAREAELPYAAVMPMTSRPRAL